MGKGKIEINKSKFRKRNVSRKQKKEIRKDKGPNRRYALAGGQGIAVHRYDGH